jgi:hypothetical protein
MRAYSVRLVGQEHSFAYLTEENEGDLHDAIFERFRKQAIEIIDQTTNAEIKSPYQGRGYAEG